MASWFNGLRSACSKLNPFQRRGDHQAAEAVSMTPIEDALADITQNWGNKRYNWWSSKPTYADKLKQWGSQRLERQVRDYFQSPWWRRLYKRAFTDIMKKQDLLFYYDTCCLQKRLQATHIEDYEGQQAVIRDYLSPKSYGFGGQKAPYKQPREGKNSLSFFSSLKRRCQRLNRRLVDHDQRVNRKLGNRLWSYIQNAARDYVRQAKRTSRQPIHDASSLEQATNRLLNQLQKTKGEASRDKASSGLSANRDALLNKANLARSIEATFPDRPDMRESMYRWIAQVLVVNTTLGSDDPDWGKGSDFPQTVQDLIEVIDDMRLYTKQLGLFEPLKTEKPLLEPRDMLHKWFKYGFQYISWDQWEVTHCWMLPITVESTCVEKRFSNLVNQFSQHESANKRLQQWWDQVPKISHDLANYLRKVVEPITRKSYRNGFAKDESNKESYAQLSGEDNDEQRQRLLTDGLNNNHSVNVFINLCNQRLQNIRTVLRKWEMSSIYSQSFANGEIKSKYRYRDSPVDLLNRFKQGRRNRTPRVSSDIYIRLASKMLEEMSGMLEDDKGLSESWPAIMQLRRDFNRADITVPQQVYSQVGSPFYAANVRDHLHIPHPLDWWNKKYSPNRAVNKHQDKTVVPRQPSKNYACFWQSGPGDSANYGNTQKENECLNTKLAAH